MAQKVQYTVSMHRPDRKRVVNRHLFEDKPIETKSDRQLLGFLTHRLFGDNERGGGGTHYVLKIKMGNLIDIRTFVRTAEGQYVRV